MRMHFAMALSAAVFGATAFAQGPQGTQTSLVATTKTAEVGKFCENLANSAHKIDVPQHSAVDFHVSGAPDTPYVLFVGMPVQHQLWQEFPEIDGLLAMSLDLPPVTLSIGVHRDGQPAANRCGAAVDTFAWTTGNLPIGTKLRFQAVGFNGYGVPAPVLSFTRPMDVTVV